MKHFKKVALLVILGLAFSGSVFALSIFQPFQGGTGTGSVPNLGGILAGDGAGKYGVQSSGTNGQVLTANSAATFGLDWEGAVTSVSNSDGTLTVSPTSGNVIESLNTAHSNTFTVEQAFKSNTLAGYFTNNAGTVGVSLVQSGTQAAEFFDIPGNDVFLADGTYAINVVTGNVNLQPLTASRALILDSSKNIAVSSTTNTQLAYLSSATGTTGTASTNLVFSTSPVFITPTLGAATATTINGLTLTSTTGTLTIASGKTLTISNTLRFAGTDGTQMTFPAASDTVAGLGTAQTFTAAQSFTAGAVATIPVTVNNIEGQTGDMTDWVSGTSNTVMTRVTPNGWLQNTTGTARLTAPVTSVVNTFANFTDLKIDGLVAGRKYIGTMTVFANNSTATEGMAIDFNGGTATITSGEFGFAGASATGAVIGTDTSTALATAITYTRVTATDGGYTIKFNFVANAGGTLIPRYACVSHTIGTLTVNSADIQIWDSPK